jgi:2-methylcitrate dehydratase PrpD
MENRTITEKLANWVCKSRSDNLPAHLMHLIKCAFLDTFGVTISGSRTPVAKAAAKIHLCRSEVAVASVVGMGCKTTVLDAAFINGVSAHAELFDDNSVAMIAHPSAPLICAILPLAQARNSSGQEILTAYALGFEIGHLLGQALNPSFYELGWHNTRVLGVFGATAACCRILRLDEGRTANALGIVSSMTSGIRQNFGSMTMPLHVGLTARDAIHASLLAEAGVDADRNAFEGKYGFLPTYARSVTKLGIPGSNWDGLQAGIIFKPYPSGAPTHAAVDAAIAINKKLREIHRIKRVICRVHPWNKLTLRDDVALNPANARISLRYCVATALLTGSLTSDSFDPARIDDKRISELIKSIDIEIASDLPDNGQFPAEVVVETTDGERFIERRDVPPGGSSRPLSDPEIEAKFRACVSLNLSGTEIQQVKGMVFEFEKLNDLSGLLAILQRSELSHQQV